MSKSINGISVIICCYNSSLRIEPTLRHLALQKFDHHINWEIILVDNNSTDGTAAFAQNIWDKLNSLVDFQIVKEGKPGHNFAKIRGIDEAKYDLLLLCDDDNWLNEKYISTGFNFMQKYPNTGLIGGRGIPVFEQGFNLPKWFEEASKFHYAVHHPSNEKDSNNASHVYGAASIIRRKIFNLLEDKNYALILSGRTKTEVKSGDDIEISYLVKLLKFDVFFINDLSFHHFLPKEKISKSWISGKISDCHSPLIISAYMDIYSNSIKSKGNYYLILIQYLFKITLISLKKTFFFDWGFYSRLWLKSQLKSCLYRFSNYSIYKNAILHIQQLANNKNSL